MPKKTKKQKLLAEKRIVNSYQPHVFSYTPTPLKSSPKLETTNNTLTIIKRDLVKTVSIGIVFIIGEFILANFIGN